MASPIQDDWNTLTLGVSKWVEVPAKMKFNRVHCVSVVVNQCIYIMGGAVDKDGSRKMLDSVEMYDTVSKRMCSLPSMNELRKGCGAAVVNNKIYVMGGNDGHGCLDSIEVFDVGSNKWSVLPSTMGTARSGCVAVAIGDYIYAIGGYNENEICASVEVFNTLTSTWAELPPMNSKRRGAAAISLGDCIYVMGGQEAAGSYVSTMESYNTKTKKWNVSYPCMSTERFGGGAVAISNKSFIVMGGYQSNQTLNSVEAYHVDHKKWIVLPDMLVPRGHGSCVFVGDCVYAVGGNEQERLLDSMEKMELGFFIPRTPILPTPPNELECKKRIQALEIHGQDLLVVREKYLLEVRELKDRRLAKRQKRMDLLQNEIKRLQHQIPVYEQEFAEEDEKFNTVVLSWTRKIDELMKASKFQMDSLRSRNYHRNGLKGVDKGIPEELLCPITLDLMTDPVMAADGFTYERGAIERILNGSANAKSPQTNEPLAHRHLIPNHAVRSMCQKISSLKFTLVDVQALPKKDNPFVPHPKF